MIEEESRYLLASVGDQVGEGETARLAKEAMERAREEARRLGFPTQGLLLRADRGSAFQSEAFRKSSRCLCLLEGPRASARLGDCIGA